MVSKSLDYKLFYKEAEWILIARLVPWKEAIVSALEEEFPLRTLGANIQGKVPIRNGRVRVHGCSQTMHLGNKRESSE